MIKRLAFLTILIACLFHPLLSEPLKAVAKSTRTTNTAYLFVEVETTVHRKADIDHDDPRERRWYISNVVVQPEDVPDYSLVNKKIIPYFNRNVVDPAEKRGIVIDYYDNDVRLNGESSYANYATRGEAEEARNKAIDYRKNQSGNIYSFEVVFGQEKGEETSKPKLIYRDKEKPNYESEKAGKPGGL